MTMGRTLKEMIAGLPTARRRAIKKRTAALIAARKVGKRGARCAAR
jgi:hypothetical protein